MDYDATLVLRNTFLTLRLTNHDDDDEEVEEVAKHLAARLKMDFLYIEEVPE